MLPIVAPRSVARVVAVVTLVCLLCHLTSRIVFEETAVFTSTVLGFSASVRGLQNVSDVSRSELRVDSQHGLDKTQTNKVRHFVRVFCFQWENYRHAHARVLLGALSWRSEDFTWASRVTDAVSLAWTDSNVLMASNVD